MNLSARARYSERLRLSQSIECRSSKGSIMSDDQHTDYFPKSVLLVSRVNFDAVLHAPMARYMQEKYGTRFTVVVGSEGRKKQWRNWLGNNVRLEVEGGFVGIEHTTCSDREEFKIARTRESAYGITYMRHILHQDKGTAAVMLQHAPGSAFARAKLPDYVEMVRRINRQFDFLEALHSENAIDLIVARNSGLFNSAAIAFARKFNIPSTWLNYLRVEKRMTWMEGPDHSNKYIKKVMATIPDQEPIPLSEIVPPIDANLALDITSQNDTWASVFKQLLQISKEHAGHILADIKRGERGKRLSPFASGANVIRKRDAINRLKKVSETDIQKLTEEPFVLFLLHLDPEYTSSTLARHFNHVHATVQQLALSLPAGYKLVIKEHVWGLGNRARSFYDDLLKLPNVIIADYRIRSTKIAEKAKFVSTVSGTIAIEASLMGIPVIMFTPYTEFADFDTIHIVDNIAKLNDVVQNVLEPRSEEVIEKSRRDAAKFRAAQIAASFDLPELDIYVEGNTVRDIDLDDVSKTTVENATTLLVDVARSQVQEN